MGGGGIGEAAGKPFAGRLAGGDGVPLLVAWLLAMRFSAAPFPAEVSVGAVAAMSVGALATVAAGLLASCALPGPPGALAPGRSRLPCAAAGFASTLVPHAALALAGGGSWPGGFPVGAVYAVSGVLLGAVLLAVLHDAARELSSAGFSGFVAEAAVSLAVGSALFLVLCAALPAGSGWAICVLPAGFAVLGATGARPAGEPQRLSARDGAGAGRQYDVMLALAGFVTAYMPSMYPKTASLPVYNLAQGACLGLTSWRSVFSIALLLGMLALLCFVFDRRRRGATVGVAAVVALFAAMFFALPSMSTSPLPFVLISPASLALSLILLGSLCAEGVDRVLRGLLVMSSGALCAGVFSAVFLGPLYGALELQDWLFNLTPAVLLVAVVALALFNEERLSALLFPTSDAESSRVVGALDQRCAEVSARYSLTARESQVLALVAEGRNEPYIEKALSISRATVKTHVTHIYRKVGVSSRQELLDELLG